MYVALRAQTLEVWCLRQAVTILFGLVLTDVSVLRTSFIESLTIELVCHSLY